MTRPRILNRTPYRHGPYVVVRFTLHRGYGIVDDRDGRLAFTEPHPNSGRPIAPPLRLERAREILATLD